MTYSGISGRRFDRIYGVTTHAVLFLSDLDPEEIGDAAAHATHYEAVPVAEFRTMLDVIPSSVIASSSFVDIGAGMGRAMLLACEYPFRSVFGIEISPGLCEIARENIDRADASRRRCHDLRVIRGDARLWNAPRGDVVAFLFNPFDGEALEATLSSLRHRRDPGDTHVLYHTAVHRDVFDDDWQLVEEFGFGAIYRLCHEA